MAASQISLDEFNVSEIDSLPRGLPARGKPSIANEIHEQLLASKTRMLRIEADSQKLRRLYGTLVQWRTRHQDVGLELRIRDGALYVWLSTARAATLLTDRPESVTVENAGPPKDPARTQRRSRLAVLP